MTQNTELTGKHSAFSYVDLEQERARLIEHKAYIAKVPITSNAKTLAQYLQKVPK